MNRIKAAFLRTPWFLAVLCVALLSKTAHADSISFNLAPANQAVVPGSTVLFSATVIAASSNSSNTYLNGDSFSLSGPFQLDDSAFFTNFPLFLTPGQSFTGTLFSVYAPVGSAFSTFSGNFQLLGGSSSNAYTNIGSQNFSVTVTPEPSTLLLMGTGLIGLLLMQRRRSSSPSAFSCRG